MSVNCTIPLERGREGVFAFIYMIQHPEEFEVCEANGELFVRPQTKSRKSKNKWPINVNREVRTTMI